MRVMHSFSSIVERGRAAFGKAQSYLAFASGIRSFLAHTTTEAEAIAMIKARLHRREDNFLALARAAIYPYERSPYRKLLELVGCSYGDLEKLVRAEGLDGALTTLFHQGVCVSLDEFKARTPAVRGSQTLYFQERDFDNPAGASGLAVMSGASRSKGTRTIYDFDFMAKVMVPNMHSRYHAWEIADYPTGIWFPIMPAGGPVFILLLAKMGRPPLRWFSQTDSRNARSTLESRAGTAAVVHLSRLFGAGAPSPETTLISEAGKVARWLVDTIRVRGGCIFESYVSSATRVCQAAHEAGLDLRGANFVATGEPLSRAKRAEIEAVNARVFASYGFSEGAEVGAGCPRFVEPDEVHFRRDIAAVIQQPREVPMAQVSVDAFYFTSLLLEAPKVLLNYGTGDYGVITRRDCGCRFQALGFHDHIHTIRAFDKLTSEGMTFVGNDVLKLIEEVLPREFGGRSTDYQMVEEEDERGRTRLSILINPALGNVDEARVLRVVLEDLSREKSANRMMAEVWNQAGTLRVRRAVPYTTARGKLLPLHIHKAW